MKITEAAARLGISDQTLREWARDYQQFLSPGANPGRNQHREFSEQDLKVLVLIRDRKRSSDFNSESLPEFVISAIETDSLPPMPDPLPSKEDIQGQIQLASTTWQVERAALQAKVDQAITLMQISRQRIEELEEGRRQDIERLMRENGALREEIAKRDTLIELYESGRLKPNT